jgi:phage baseplate assembly protein W
MVEVITGIYDVDSNYTEGQSKNIIVAGREAIDNLIQNLFSTSSAYDNKSYGERVYEPTYGCELERRLFEPMDEMVAEEIQTIIYDAIVTFLGELYVTRDSIAVRPNYKTASYDVLIVYKYDTSIESTSFSIASGG